MAHFSLEQDLLAARFPVENGMVVVPKTPGLGIDVDPDLLGKYRVLKLSA